MYRQLRTTWPAWTSSACFAAWGTLVLLLHLLEPHHALSDRTISEYVLSDHGYLMQAAFVVLGVGMLALALGALRWFRPAPRLYAGLLALAGASAFLVLVFNTDSNVEGAPRTLTGYLHTGAVILGTTPVAVAAALAPSMFKRDDAWRPHSRVALVWAVAVIAATVLQVAAAGTGLRGAFQRADLVVITGWLLFMSIRLFAANRPSQLHPRPALRPAQGPRHSTGAGRADRSGISRPNP